MIIVRSPLRITLGGGGSDIPAYYQKHGGFCLAAAIDKYVYVSITRPFFRNIFLKYSSLERVVAPEDVRHPIIREALLEYCKEPQIEITTLADIPAGTGLGSSSSFTTALVKALCTYYRKDISTRELAEKACEIEIERCQQPIGKQDQHIAAYGGIQGMTFHPDGTVHMAPAQLSPGELYDLEDHLLLFYTGIQRQTGPVLQSKATATGEEGRHAFKFLDAPTLGLILNSQWKNKKERSPHAVTPEIEKWYKLGIGKGGAIGGKLVGAGGGGFLLFYSADHSRLRQAMAKAGLEEVRFRFDFEGTKVLVQ